MLNGTASAYLAADDLKLRAKSVEQFKSGQDVVRVRVFALLEVQSARSA
jgi:hypothetical protein